MTKFIIKINYTMIFNNKYNILKIDIRTLSS
jgi:hypothetical protein